MKKLYSFLSVILFVAAVLFTNTASATPVSSTSVPINSGIVYLAIAGVIIGVVALRKFKGAKA